MEVDLNATQASSDDAGGAATVSTVATNLEVIVISVSRSVRRSPRDVARSV